MAADSRTSHSAVGIISGTGPAGRALASRLAAAGTVCVIGSRDRSKAAKAVADLVLRWGGEAMSSLSVGDNGAAASCDLVVIATDAAHALDVAAAHRSQLAGKVVVTMAAHLRRTDRGMAAVLPEAGSIAAAMGMLLPDSSIVAALHSIPAAGLGNLDMTLDVDVLTAADSADAISEVASVLSPVTRGRFLDAGPLANAAALEALTAVLISVNISTRSENSIRLIDASGS